MASIARQLPLLCQLLLATVGALTLAPTSAAAQTRDGAVGARPATERGDIVAQQVVPYFPETGFAIDEPAFAGYFERRGRIRTFGYPTSRSFLLLGMPTQFFQRIVLQRGPDGSVRTLNLLDQGLLPYTRINGSTFPAPDERLAAAAPTPGRPSYATDIVDFVRRHAPETFEGQPVRFFSTFNNTVSLTDAFPDGGDPNLLPLINLEIWGVPTSAPARDPNNGNFIYQRFQRGIMHYDAACRCTQGLLLADYLKALITGENLPADLEQQAKASPFLRQLSRTSPNGVSRPDALAGSDLRQAFVRQPAPVTGAAVSVPAEGPSAPFRTRMKLDRALWTAVDALEEAGRLAPLNAIVQSETEVTFGDLPDAVHARYSRTASGLRRVPIRQIVVSNRWRKSDPKALATVIAHEGKHLEDDLAGVDPRRGLEACFQFEIRAFTEQAVVWEAFYGPSGKARAQDDLDAELNRWLAAYRRGQDELEQLVRQYYGDACGQVTRRG